MAKTHITDSERLQLIGLLSVGAQLLQQLNTVDQAMCTLRGVQPDSGGYSGHINDTLYEADTHSPIHLADGLLRRLSIEVIPPTPAAEEVTTSGSENPPRIVLPTGYTPTPPREEPPF